MIAFKDTIDFGIVWTAKFYHSFAKMYPRITLILCVSLFLICWGGEIVELDVDNFWQTVYDPSKTVIVLYTAISPMCWLCRPVEAAFEVAHANYADDPDLVWARSRMKKTDLRKAGVTDFEVFGWPRVIAYPQVRKHKHLFLMGEFRNPARYDGWIPLIKEGKNYPRFRFNQTWKDGNQEFNTPDGVIVPKATDHSKVHRYCCKNWFY